MNYLGFLVTQLGPMLVLITLNVMIYRALKRNITPNTNSDNGTIRRNVGRSASTDALRKRDIRLTRISIIIVTIFIICHFPRIIPNVAEMAEVNLAKVCFVSWSWVCCMHSLIISYFLVPFLHCHHQHQSALAYCQLHRQLHHLLLSLRSKSSTRRIR